MVGSYCEETMRRGKWKRRSVERRGWEGNTQEAVGKGNSALGRGTQKLK